MRTVKIDSKDFTKGLDAVQMRQVPFAMAKTLTDCAKLGQTGAKRETRENFDLHSDFIPSQIVIIPAKVSDVKAGRAFSAVRGTEKIGFMTIHDEGGTKAPVRGKAIAVPTFLAQKRIPGLRTRTGRISPKFKPKQLLEGWPPGVNRGYTEGGLLFKKLRKREDPFPIFDFERIVKIKPAWEFNKTVREGVSLMASSFFRRNLIAALSTGR